MSWWDIFNWQDEAEGMISQMEFVRRVDVQTETIERYVREGKLVPDLVVPMSEHRTFKYFKEETLEKYAAQYGWTLIDDSNRKELFLDMIRQMDMSYSYKPVLIQAILHHTDEKGRIQLADIVTYFRAYYEGRRAAGLVVEKKTASSPRAATPTKRQSGTFWQIPSNGSRICRCSVIPRPWASSRWMNRCGRNSPPGRRRK